MLACTMATTTYDSYDCCKGVEKRENKKFNQEYRLFVKGGGTCEKF